MLLLTTLPAALLPAARPARARRVEMMAASPSALPKIETGVAAHLDQYETHDGRNVLVAVLDTGCDLAAAGLQKTSDGRNKYVDFLDCTGGGDVDTRKVVERDADGTIPGLSGRSLTLGAWADGVDSFHVGGALLFPLLPSSARGRIQKERKASFSATQHAAMTEAQRALDAIEADATLAADEKSEKKKDAELLLKELKGMMEKHDDAGPMLDVVAFEKDGVWRVVVSDGADLTSATPMAPFATSQQVGDFGHGSETSYCVQVYDGGDTVSLVTDAGSHGTHVAGIVAACDDDPARNGVAPGARILACKIGDGRLDSAETGTGLVRALIAAKRYGCDLINLSYGEPFHSATSGRVAETFAAAVREWGMAVFISAGNAGPALSTVGAPGCISEAICVGAAVSPQMMADQYSTLPYDAAGTSYYFSSRGPTPDGHLPTLCAPGGAIAPVPRHTLQGKAQYHGTSMSSPNACGVAAVVLSALKAQGVNVGPIELRRALENSATPLDDPEPFAQGVGLINAPGAISYALAHHGKPGQHLGFAVELPSRRNARGLYLRDAAELEGPLSFGVSVKPLYDLPLAGRSEDELDELLGTEIEVALKASAPWVTAPASMVLLSARERGSQSFTVKLNPDGLPAGVHFARVDATDAADPSRGVLFSLPVTVVVPEGCSTDGCSVEPPKELGYALRPGVPSRRFVATPEVAEWAEVTLRTGALPDGPHNIVFHAVPSARGDVPHAYLETKKILQLREYATEKVMVPVRGGASLEICMQLLWLQNPSAAPRRTPDDRPPKMRPTSLLIPRMPKL